MGIEPTISHLGGGRLIHLGHAIGDLFSIAEHTS